MNKDGLLINQKNGFNFMYTQDFPRAHHDELRMTV